MGELYNGGYREYLLEKKVDGSYKITLRTYDKDGAYKEQIEVGDWGIFGSVYFTISLGDIEDKEEYKILNLSDSEFRYQHIECEDIYIMKRVSDSFTLDDK